MNQENINNIKDSIATIEKITSTEIDNAIRKYEDKLNSFNGHLLKTILVIIHYLM